MMTLAQLLRQSKVSKLLCFSTRELTQGCHNHTSICRWFHTSLWCQSSYQSKKQRYDNL